jgi:maltose 6'-phosphate phosphatase
MHCGMEDKLDEKIDRIINYIIDNDITVIALQEVGQQFYQDVLMQNFGVDVKRHNLADVITKRINQKSDYHYDFYFDWSHIGFDTIEEGCAIITSYPILSVDSKYVSRNKTTSFWKSRKVIKMKIKVDGQALNLYNCHLGWWGDDEEPAKDQFDTLHQWASNESTPNILVGDFNNPAGQVGYEYLVDTLGYRDLFYESNLDSFYAPTFYKSKKNDELEVENIDERIDYIFTNSDAIKAVKSKLIFTRDDGMVSDHVAICAELKID